MENHTAGIPRQLGGHDMHDAYASTLAFVRPIDIDDESN